MSFFSVDVYRSFVFGTILAYMLRGLYARHKETRQNEIDLNKKHHERYYDIYYRVAQLEEKMETLEGKYADTLIHD
jgi:hypothetical protein